MKIKMHEALEIPEGVNCSISNNVLNFSKGSINIIRIISDPTITAKVNNGELVFECNKGNRNQHKTIKSLVAHIKNIFSGLDEKFVYHLEACNVHFPMTLKIEGNKLIINNFLGEKTSRSANILPGVEVDLKGQKITVSSHDFELAGQTVANIEKATKVRNRDRRIFQDGIYLTQRPRRKM